MEKIVRYRKAFYEKENDFQTGNTKPHHATKGQQSACCEAQDSRRQHKPKTNSQIYCQLYAHQALQAITHHSITPFLANHKIDSMLRARMLDWMVEVTCSYKFTEKGYFDSVYLMDRYFEKETNCLQANQLHIVGVTSMLIASKISELNPLKIKTVFEKIAHRKLPLNDLLSTQARIIQKLDYQLNNSTFFDLACIKLTNCFYSGKKVLTKIDKNCSETRLSNTEQNLQRILSICCYLSRLVLFDYEFIQKDTLLLAECIAKTALELGEGQVILEVANSEVDLQMCKVEMFRGIRRFRQNFKGLNNVFKFTHKDTVKLLENYAE